MPVTKKKPGTIKRRLKKAAVVGGIVLATTGIGLKGKAIVKHNVAERKQATHATTALRTSKSVRNASNWGTICAVYNWNPITAGGNARIKLIESVSEKTKVAPERVMLTIESNYLDAVSTKAWNARLNSLKRQLSDAQLISNTQKGFERRRAASRVKLLNDKIGQANRVIVVMNQLIAENPKLAKQIQKEVLGSVGTQQTMNKLSRRNRQKPKKRK